MKVNSGRIFKSMQALEVNILKATIHRNQYHNHYHCRYYHHCHCRYRYDYHYHYFYINHHHHHHHKNSHHFYSHLYHLSYEWTGVPGGTVCRASIAWMTSPGSPHWLSSSPTCAASPAHWFAASRLCLSPWRSYSNKRKTEGIKH